MDVELNMHINVEQLVAETRAAAARGLHQGAEHVLTMTGPKVPWQEGHLERSGTVSVDESELVGAISFDQPYAVRQHEELDFNHPVKGEAKFLETTLRDEAEAVKLIVAKHIRRALRS
ncbi:hypothetical protein [Nonomuraea lactucae]|uniref:hypothetical protein n=1 Tax=Nonomuraea lactucae TaxID=2249762 RepID=UPI000DE51029|nr:hypothetical protein [Nonomuraea lactucae]